MGGGVHSDTTAARDYRHDQGAVQRDAASRLLHPAPACALTSPQAPCQGSTLQASIRIFRVPPLAWHPRAPYRTPWSHPMVRTRTSSAPWPAEHRLLGMSPTIGLLRGSEPGRCQLRSTRVLETRMCASKRLAQYPSTQRTIDRQDSYPLHLRASYAARRGPNRTPTYRPHHRLERDLHRPRFTTRSATE